MHGLLAPVIAQLVTLALADRVEGDYILNRDRQFFESRNTAVPGATLQLSRKRVSLTLGYAAPFTVVPLERQPRELVLLHTAFLGGQYRWRRTTLSLNEAASYGERDLQGEALLAYQTGGNAPPAVQTQPTPAQLPPGGTGAPPGGTGTSPGANGSGATANGGTATGANAATPAVKGLIPYGTFRSSGSLDHVLSRQVALHFAGGYSIAGGTTRVAQRILPLVRGPDGTASLIYALDARNKFGTIGSWQLAFSETGTNAFLAALGEDYTHWFARRTTANVGAGISLSRAEPPIGLPLYGVYPTGHAGIAHAERVARGDLTLSLSVTATPVLDLTTTTIDPRIGVSVSSGWSRTRFSLTATLVSSLSVAPESVNAFNSIAASVVARYDLGAKFALDGGVRGVWQSYGGATLVQPSTVFFAGLSWGAALPLNERHQ